MNEISFGFRLETRDMRGILPSKERDQKRNTSNCPTREDAPYKVESLEE